MQSSANVAERWRLKYADAGEPNGDMIIVETRLLEVSVEQSQDM